MKSSRPYCFSAVSDRRRAGLLWTAGMHTGAVATVVSLCMILSAASLAGASETVAWHSYDQGMSLGRQQRKKVLINFYADWCTYCKKMDTETFSDRAVAAYVNTHFIAIKVNSDRASDIASLYRVQGLPSTWFVAESGEKISNLPGFVPPALFIRILEYIHTDSHERMSFREFRDRS